MESPRRVQSLKIVVAAGFCALFVCLHVAAAFAGRGATIDDLAAVPASWRPRREAGSLRYAGAQACAECHSTIHASYHRSAMNKALLVPAASEVLKSPDRFTFRDGKYLYAIKRQGGQSIYTVSDGARTLAVPVLYAFGLGKLGQTFIFERDGRLYESRVSFYRGIDNLDFTNAELTATPASLEEAAGRALPPRAAASCFSCHATAATKNGELDRAALVPGVSCEACHGPGENHVIAMRRRAYGDSKIFNPARLSPDELSQEFCGACHRGADDVAQLTGLAPINNVRFQPYRLFVSRSHDPSDPRLSCTACHDPHGELRPLETDARFYDAKCTACHQVSSRLPAVAPRAAKLVRKSDEPKASDAAGRDAAQSAPPCPVAIQNCASCHMPKIEVPGAHHAFTDHRIRVVRRGEPYPP